MIPKGCAYIVLCSLLFVSGTPMNPNDFVQDRNSNGCILPPYPEHGRWELLNGKGNPGDTVLIASVITFDCESRYKLSSKIPLVCLGEWSSQVPQCEELCPPLYPSNAYDLRCVDKLGKEISCAEATNGTNLEYTCKTFYETPFGYKKTLFCENGKWDNPKPVCQPVCGKKVSNDVETLIYGSKPNEKIEHPWVAAIYKRINDSYENICGGSILSQTVVLTAAHCVTDDYGNTLLKEYYMVGVGKLYRRYLAPEDTRAQYSELYKIMVPPEYKADSRKFSADLAVLVLKDEVTINNVVQPVCFTNMNNIHLHAGHKGEVSGWGLAEGEIPSEVLRTLVIPYKYETVCADELPSDWADKYNLRDKICAGFVNKSTAVCSGDSGGGLVFKNREDNRYYVHGIVSVSHQVKGMCDIQQNAVYTSVAAYYKFVDPLLTKYAPKLKDCLMPNYPQNGKWTSERENLKPGDLVASNTLLKVKCDNGFKVSSSGSVKCSEAHNMPTCEMMCPRLNFPRETDLRCSNKDGETIDCSTAVDKSTLRYFCPRKYQKADDWDKRICIKGSWGLPKPECILECGKKVVDSSGVGADYPWNVGIYKLNDNSEEKKREDEKYKYICSGSLVSQYVVVTAAQCVTDESYHLQSKDDYLIGAGKLYAGFDDPRDIHAQFTNITYINVHPHYNLSKGTIENIALLIASRPLSYDNFVQPLCVTQNDGFSYSYKNYESTKMIGWRFSQNVSSKTVEAVEVDQPIITQRFKIRIPSEIIQDLEAKQGKGCEVPPQYSPHHFSVQNGCSRFKNESTCLQPEDRGKGIIVKNTENDRYYLVGVVLYFEDATCQRFFWNSEIIRFYTYIEFTASYL